jgi:pSer/pThr/pTyr-binding forkhead associated (FHA) protein/ribosomal protein L40E
LRIVNVSARKSPIEVDTGPLPGRPAPTTALSRTSAQIPVVQEKTSVLNPTGLLSSLKTGADTGKSISMSMIEALKEKPGLIVMPVKDAKSAKKELQPQVFLLQRGKRVMIGREEGNDIVLRDMDVSRRHAEVFPAPDGVYIRDNNSSNGVLINQSKIERPCRLSHGDRIKLGNTVMVFVDLQAGREQTNKVTTLPTQPLPPQKTQQLLQKALPPQKAEPVPVEVTARIEPPQKQATSRTVKVQANQGQVQMKICAQCSTPNMPSARFCARCSAPLLSLR